MRTFLRALLVAALYASHLLAPAHAAPSGGPELVRAQVVKVDAPRGKLTLKHAPIKSISMEAMTMPFKVRDPAWLATLKPGDKICFAVAVEDDELVVTRIEAAK